MIQASHTKTDSAAFADWGGGKKAETLCRHVRKVIEVLLESNFFSENDDRKGDVHSLLPILPQILLNKKLCIITVLSLSGLLANYLITFYT